MTNSTHQVILGLASNVNHQQNMEVARQLLDHLLENLHFTSAHWTEPVNALRPDMYLNQLAKGTTNLEPDELNQRLKDIEQQLDRKHDKSGIVTIDIDLLAYDSERYHLRDWERDYVKDLLPEL
jgi:2-amino-4-hydroxy-6-hydroxymethyldihydropteridine diphosphokinase